MEVAKIQVGGTCACAYEKKTIRAGMVGVTVSFAFDEYWDDLNKIAVYRCGGVVRDEYLEGDTGTIPAEVLTKSGFDLEIGVYGTDAEKQIAIPTCWANLGVVRPGADPSGDPAADPELPFWAKVQEWLKTRFVKTVNGIGADENGNVDIPASKVEVDPTLTKEGSAADAKAVGEGLAEKEPLVLRVTISSNDYGATYVSSHSASEIAAHYNDGGSVIAVDSTNRFSDIRWVNDSSVTFENTYIDNVYGDVYFVYFTRYEVFEDKSVTKTSKGSNIIASDEIWQFQSGPVTGKGVYNYAVPIPETAEVGQTIAVDAVDENGKPTAWKAVDMASGGTVELDATLSVEGSAADAKAVSDALADKAKKPLIINADDAPTTGSNSVSGIPIFTIDYSPADLKAYADAGGSVTIVRYNRHYAMYDATEETAKFRFIEATDTQVDGYHAVLDANKAVTITKTTHKSRMETTTGGAVGQIPIIKSLDSKGRPSTWEFADITDILPVYNGEVGEA